MLLACIGVNTWSLPLCTALPPGGACAWRAQAPLRWGSVVPQPAPSSKTYGSCRLSAPPSAELSQPRPTRSPAGSNLGSTLANRAEPRGRTLHKRPWLHLYEAEARCPRECEFWVAQETCSEERADALANYPCIRLTAPRARAHCKERTAAAGGEAEDLALARGAVFFSVEHTVLPRLQKLSFALFARLHVGPGTPVSGEPGLQFPWVENEILQIPTALKETRTHSLVRC